MNYNSYFHSYEFKLLRNIVLGTILFILFSNHIIDLYGFRGKVGLTLATLLIGAGALKLSHDEQYGRLSSDEGSFLFYLCTFGFGGGIIFLFFLKAFVL